MKKLTLMVAMIAIAAYGAGRGDVQRILERAVAGEREAIARYDAYAAKAAEEGYAGVAVLFRAQAAAERVHEQRFVAAMKQRGLAVPANEAKQPTVWTTQDNLRAAVQAENQERDGIYKDSIEAANLAGDSEVAKIFDQTRDTENEHGNLCGDALRKFAKMKETKAYYVCDACGYTTDVDLPLCPLCRAGKHPHKIH